VPLAHDEALLGFVALANPKTPFTLTFEDHDLLKTAGQQIASYLAQEKAIERLTESRQFEAYNRFTAFVMHDLKNAVAQQSLVVENAEKHKHNPEFIDDAIETIRGSVDRLRRVLAHLRQSTLEQSVETVDLERVVLEVASRCADREPVPVANVPGTAVPVRANRERLVSAINHTVRNAQEACGSGGEVRIALTVQGDECAVTITDNGEGMDAIFVRDRLFRPFDSTKGAEGMGIGAYQVRESVRAAGGEVDVSSAPGEGTTFRMRLPLSSRDAS
jgi:putative PEP-CTERM system histidine kinase